MKRESLPARVAEFYAQYLDTIPHGFKPRGEDFLRWSLAGSKALALSCTPETQRQPLAELNTLAILLNGMIDDLADLVGDEALVASAVQLLGDPAAAAPTTGDYASYLGLIARLRDHVQEQCLAHAGAQQWCGAYQQFLQRYQQAMRASITLNRAIHEERELGSPMDLDRFVVEMSPPIHTGIYLLINLMMSGPVPEAEQPAIERLVRLSEQYMVLGNWLATWEEEIVEGDFTSGVIALALQRNVVTLSTLKSLPRDELRARIKNERPALEFTPRLTATLAAIRSLATEIHYFDVNAYADALSAVFKLHLDHADMLKHGKESAASARRPDSATTRTSAQEEEEVRAYYDETHGSYEKWGNPEVYELHYGFHETEETPHLEALRRMNEEVASAADVQRGDHVLDAGCGVGASGIFLAQERGARVHGITLVESQRVQASAFAKKNDVSGVTFSVADFLHTPFADGEFNVVWGIESVCYASSKRAFLEEAFRVLAPGGRVVIADYFLTKEMEEMTDLERHTMERWLEGWAMPNLASAKSIADDCAAAGFRECVQRDVTREVLPSAKEIEARGRAGFPDDLFAHNNTVVKLRHVEACLFQGVCLRQGLWTYRIVTATK